MKRSFPFLSICILMVLLLSACGALDFTAATQTPTETPSPSPTETLEPTQTPTPLPGDAIPTLILSLGDNGYAHLFGFSPGKFPMTRLTNGLWDDVSPALSPDGQKLVFASNRNDYWDLYLLDLTTGQLARLTDTPQYEGNPSWSPDGQWVVYDTYVNNNLEISIQSTSSGDVINLSNSPTSADSDPSWSPEGRKIAFVSNRSGEDEIWVADLDQPDPKRFTDISQSPDGIEAHPVWSPDGTKLAWESARLNRPESIYVWDSNSPANPARRIGSGGWPAWNDNGTQLAVRFQGPNQDYLGAYTLDGLTTLPIMPIAALHGLDWRTIRVAAWPRLFQRAALLTPTPLWEPQVRPQEDIPNQRASVIKLNNVEAPHPFLHDGVDEAFTALRRRVVAETGWDSLASLADAYEPLTSTLDPGKGEDWLYTGRAFALNPLTLSVGWMLVVREDMDGQTYWRVYLRALAQDGSQGEPLSSIPWDLNARYDLDPQSYDRGGALMESIPPGYWVDFTNLAREYGWQRIAAQNDWRTYFAGTQFNEFIITDGLDWRSAMLQLYPADVFITPTVVVPPTLTPTKTLIPYALRSQTPTTTLTPTPRPTFTPEP